MNGFLRLLTAFLLITFCPVAQASAQIEGSRLTRHAGKGDGAEAMKIWAQCVADLEGKWARSLLTSVPTTKAEEAVWNKHVGENDRCLEDSRLVMDGMSLNFSSESARGEIARYFVQKELASGTPVRGAALAWLHEGMAALPQGAAYNRPVLIGHEFAACLADEHWAETRTFVLAQPNSAAEKSALAALTPHFAGCMTTGARLNLNKALLRLLLSEAAYHALTYQPKAAAPVGAEASK